MRFLFALGVFQTKNVRFLCANSPTISNTFTVRTHNCGELRTHHAGVKVTLFGWVQFNRLNRFLILRDSYGSVQAFLPDSHRNVAELRKLLKNIAYESVVKIDGTVSIRQEKHMNPEMSTGDVQVEVDCLHDEEHGKESSMKLKYRYLELRKLQMQKMLRLRSSLMSSMRRFLTSKEFVEVETPTLFRTSPGGAREFLVPCGKRNPGHFYALPQSPQQCKQLLMIAGVDRYFQIARCYRDEGGRQDRQPEFTQVDLELSFTNEQLVMQLVEALIGNSWPDNLSHSKPSTPFRMITYTDSMDSFGTDKPDLRIPWTIDDCSEWLGFLRKSQHFHARLIVCKNVRQFATDEWQMATADVARIDKNVHFAFLNAEQSEWFGGNVDKESMLGHFRVEKQDTVIFCWGENLAKILDILGRLRNMLADVSGLRSNNGRFEFVWVTNFPLFFKDENGQFHSAHHPFTAPKLERPEDLQQVVNPETVEARHYDLVLNGVELGGGSIRIHDRDLQSYVLDKILKEDCSKFDYFLEALSLGAPPHGGFALGFDRYMALLFSEGDSSTPVRDVIAFPKSKEGRDVMVGTPIADASLNLEHYSPQDRPINVHAFR